MRRYEHDEIKDKFYKTPQWRRCRNAYARIRNWVCERCLNRNVITYTDTKEYYKQFIVHHKIHLTDANINNLEISLNFKNLELLCITCHNQEHFLKPVCANGYELVNGIMQKKGDSNGKKKSATS